MKPHSLRILHITPAYYPATYWGGPIFSVLGLNNALAKISGLELRVLATDSAGPRLDERLDVSTATPLIYPNGYQVFFCKRIAGVDVSPQMLWRIVLMVGWADVVHLTGTYSFSTLPTLLACRLFGKPVVWSPRGALQATHEWPGARSKWLKTVWEKIINWLVWHGRCTLHVTSIEERVASLTRIPNANAQVIRNGVDMPDLVHHSEWLPEGRLRLLFIGRLDRKKGLENLFQALRLLNDKSINLVVCGTGEKDYVQGLFRQVSDLGLSGQIDFRGHVDGVGKAAAFREADICVIPSYSENFCMVVAESLAHGVPVIASRGTPWAQVVGQGCGNWVDNDPASLADSIFRLRQCNLEEMGLAGRRWMQSEFGWDSVAEEMYGLYKASCS